MINPPQSRQDWKASMAALGEQRFALCSVRNGFRRSGGPLAPGSLCSGGVCIQRVATRRFRVDGCGGRHLRPDACAQAVLPGMWSPSAGCRAAKSEWAHGSRGGGIRWAPCSRGTAPYWQRAMGAALRYVRRVRDRNITGGAGRSHGFGGGDWWICWGLWRSCRRDACGRAAPNLENRTRGRGIVNCLAAFPRLPNACRGCNQDNGR